MSNAPSQDPYLDESGFPADHVIFAKLGRQFRKDEVKRLSKGGSTFDYVTARTVMNRLDEVLGPANWSDQYAVYETHVVCLLTIRLPDGREITRSDVGGISKTPDASDTEKTGFSDAFKRAAVKFGVGRYLYGDGRPDFVVPILKAIHEADKRAERDKAARSANGHVEAEAVGSEA